ncbi:MAG: MFS transporter [Clostridia bacterium]|nr:MFS transporter [Clostridia bacterium]
MQQTFKRLKCACYSTNLTMSVVGNLSPLLFITFRNLYGISYSLLGLLVVINFFTQLLVDLAFSFFSHKFNIEKSVKYTPVIAVVGLVLFGCAPWIFPRAIYVGLVLGTIIFSAASGLAEVLISPVIAAIPAKDPDKEMSKLHSIYAWGVVGVVVLATLYLLFVGSDYWQYLVFAFALVPLLASILYCRVDLPKMETPERVSGALEFCKNKALWGCVLAIFLGGASECTMAQWSSGYIEKALGISKVWGDIFGVALFGMALGLGRSLYAKFGKNIRKVLLFCAIGAACCYLIAAISPVPVIGLIACGLTGFCTSMMWPGSLIVAADRFPKGGVFIYAMMAAGGDLGASVGPQLIGLVTDAAIASKTLQNFAETLSLAPEQLGMKLGMLVGMLFPILAIVVFAVILKRDKTPKALPLSDVKSDLQS